MGIIILKKGDQELEASILIMDYIIIIQWVERQSQKISSNNSKMMLMALQQHLQEEDHLLQSKIQVEITQSVLNVMVMY